MAIGRILGRGSLLSRREQELRAREQELLERLAEALGRFGDDVAEDDMRHFREARAQLDGLFLLVVAGEFNSGKSSFINALLGDRILPEGVTPTTDRINLLRWGPEVADRMLEPYLVERTHPAAVLRELNVVDTPGTNAVIRRHEELTRDFVPRSDLVLFVTSADRPFTETERTFLEQIREWGKKIVVVVNKIDILANAAERDEVLGFVREHARALLGLEPEVFAVSAREAMAARGAGDEEAWDAAFGAMEAYLLETLDQDERVRLKLLNPLNVGLRLAARYRDTAYERLRVLGEDVEALERIDRKLAEFHESMLRDLQPRLSQIDMLLLEMQRRGDAFFQETIRIGRIKSLMDTDAVRREFERQVIGDTPERIDAEVGRVVDWIVERNLHVWQEIEREIDRHRIGAHDQELLGDFGTFRYNRQALLGSIGRLAHDVVGGYNREAEARKIANEVQGTFATTALAEVGAVGIGTLVATLITGAAADVTGILLATVLAVGGFYLIPRKRRVASRQFAERISALRDQLRGALERQTHEEIAASTQRINQAIDPYRRFIETQRERLTQARGELVAIADALDRLKASIEGP